MVNNYSQPPIQDGNTALHLASRNESTDNRKNVFLDIGKAFILNGNVNPNIINNVIPYDRIFYPDTFAMIHVCMLNM